jgi:bifunctional UDP-N-acetylglucosamine pyrophosphorylase/glucosamine-1-phosphate N-acetyltransferase
VDRVLVVVNYLAEKIEAYLRTQTHVPNWVTVRQVEPRGTGDALRSCREYLNSGRFLVLNGDDLFGAADLAALADCPAGVLVHPVDEPRRFGIAFLRENGLLDRLVEKPNLEGRQLANAGVYLFPREVFEIPLTLSPRGEYEITDYVTALAGRRPVKLVEARFWLPISTAEVWEQAQKIDLEKVMTGAK